MFSEADDAYGCFRVLLGIVIVYVEFLELGIERPVDTSFFARELYILVQPQGRINFFFTLISCDVVNRKAIFKLESSIVSM